ncbi:MAG: DNA repair protein RecO [Planctomycetota bacterium]|jgi:DNA repair protein RecO (recombination protein O)
MVPQTTLGVPIQRSPFSETSQIVHFLTQDWGRIVCMVKGAFRPKNNFRGNIDLLELNRISITRSRGSSIALLRSRKLLERYGVLHQHIGAFAHASLAAELIRHGVQERQKIPGLFELTLGVLSALEQGEVPPILLSFLFQGVYLSMLGFEPVLDHCVECRAEPAPGSLLAVFPKRGGVVCRHCRENDGEELRLSWDASRIIVHSIARDLPWLLQLKLDPRLTGEIWAFYTLFTQYYLEKRVNAYAFIKQIESGT